MATGMALEALAAEVERQRDSKADYVADTRHMLLHTAANGSGPRSTLALEGGGSEAWQVADFAHGQVADRLQIPRRYYNRLRTSHAALLDANVNTLWREAPERRMLRTIDGKVRAYLSDRYRRLDCWDLLEAVLPIISSWGDDAVYSCNLSESRMYLKVLLPKIQAEVAVGDIVQAGLLYSNSEVGDGTVTVQPLVYRLVCSNGMVVPAQAGNMLKAYHVGGRIVEQDGARLVYSEATVAADDRAFWLKVRDVTKAASDGAWFARTVEQMRRLLGTEEVADPPAAVEVLGQRLGMYESERTSVLAHLARGGDLTQWGMLNAITRAAQDVPSYDRATELEEMGGRVLVLPRSDWHGIAASGADDVPLPAEGAELVPLAPVALA